MKKKKKEYTSFKSQSRDLAGPEMKTDGERERERERKYNNN